MLFALSHTPQEGAGRSVGTVGCFVLTFRNRPLRSILRLPHFHAFGRIEHDIRGTHLKHEPKQATLRAFVAVFRAVRGFFRNASAGFLALGAAFTEDGNSSLGCFAVRW